MKRLVASLFWILAAASLVPADGTGPERKMTEAEASAYTNLRGTIQSALPMPPEGYTLDFTRETEFGDLSLPEAIKGGQMFGMFFRASYTLDGAVGAVQQRSYLMDKARGTPEQQAKLAELDAKNTELTKLRDTTRDRAEKDKIRAELKAVREEADELRDRIMNEYTEWVSSGGAADASQNIEESLPAKEISIRIDVNCDVSLIDTATPYAIQGIPLAFEQGEGCQGSDTYCITVLIGPFEKGDKLSGYTRYRLLNDDPGVPTKARGIALTIGGPKDKPESVREFLRQTDLAKLRSLVS